MQRKLKEYFSAGVQLVWIVDPPTRTIAVYTTPEEFSKLDENDTLTGGKVLPGYEMPMKDVFESA